MNLFCCENYIPKIALEINFNGIEKKALNFVEFQNTIFPDIESLFHCPRCFSRYKVLQCSFCEEKSNSHMNNYIQLVSYGVFT